MSQLRWPLSHGKQSNNPSAHQRRNCHCCFRCSIIDSKCSIFLSQAVWNGTIPESTLFGSESRIENYIGFGHFSGNKLSPNRELWVEIAIQGRNISGCIGLVLVPYARKPEVTEDRSPGINDLDDTLPGIRESRKLQEGEFIPKELDHNHDTHVQKQ